MDLPAIELLRPWALALLPLPVLAWWLLPTLSPRAAVAVPDTVRELLLKLGARDGGRKRLPRDIVLRAIGWTALVVALAGPHTLGAKLERPTGRDLIFAVDLSSSMDETDVMVDGEPVPRYQVVRRIIGDFLADRRGDRVGLIAFGHEAFLIAPLSFDTAAVAGTLNELAIGLPGHRTDLGRAIGLAVQSMRDQPGTSRVLVLLSDGEDNSGALTGEDAAALAAQYGLTIYSIGFTPALESDGAAILRTVAERAGGQFFAAPTPEALAGIAAEIARLEPTAADAAPVRLVEDWTLLAIAAAMASLGALTLQQVRA